MTRSWVVGLLCLLAAGAQAADPVSKLVEDLPEISRDRIAGLGGEVHFAGSALSDDDAPVTVSIAAGEPPIILVLMALSTLEWHLTGSVDRLRAVIVLSSHASERSLLTGLPDDVAAFRSDGLRDNRRQRSCPAFAARSPGGQCLDPELRIDGERIVQAGLLVTGKRDGFASLSIGWRSRTLGVPGRPDVLRSVAEARDLLTRELVDQPGNAALSTLRDRLTRLGERPALSVANGSGQELHLVDAGPCAIGQICASRQTVTVPATGRPIILALRASRDVDWAVEVEYGARLAGILLLGESAPLSLQAPAVAPVAVLLDAMSAGTHPILHLLEPSRRDRDIGAWERLEPYPATGDPITLR